LTALYFASLLILGSVIPAILIIKIGFLKACQWRVFKKPILVFPAPKALEIPKSVS